MPYPNMICKVFSIPIQPESTGFISEEYMSPKCWSSTQFDSRCTALYNSGTSQNILSTQ